MIDSAHEPAPAGTPGVLYFDPNPTTARLASAGLRLAGYEVHVAETTSEAVQLCRRHGPAGDGAIVALLLDAAHDAEATGELLRMLIQVPGAVDLPGILVVSRSKPEPIAGAEGLPILKRPFTTPALVKTVREAIENGPEPRDPQRIPLHALGRIETLLRTHFPGLEVKPKRLRKFASALVHDVVVPPVPATTTMTVDLSTFGLDIMLAQLELAASRGVITAERGPEQAQIHVDQGKLRLADVISADEDLRVGRFIVEDGVMNNERLEQLAEREDAQLRPLGQRLVEDGHIAPQDLARVLIQQAREVACRVMDWTHGRASFAPTDTVHPLAALVADQHRDLPIASVLLEGLRRRERKAEMGPHMPGVDDVFLRDDDAVAQLGRHGFTRDELTVLELLNGRNSVKDLARKTRTGTFAVANVLYRLQRGNLVRKRTQPVSI